MSESIAKALPVQCVFCSKIFSKGSNMDCGAKVPSHIARGENGSWCKTDDIAKMLESQA